MFRPYHICMLHTTKYTQKPLKEKMQGKQTSLYKIDRKGTMTTSEMLFTLFTAGRIPRQTAQLGMKLRSSLLVNFMD